MSESGFFNVVVGEKLRARVEEEMEKWPTLCYFGFVDGERLKGQGQEEEERKKEREELRSDHAIAQVAFSMAYLSFLKRTKTMGAGSYGLKHLVEEWTDQYSDRQYISNGSLIMGAIVLGLRVKQDRRGSPNASINVRIR